MHTIDLNNLFLSRAVESRSISAENPNGEPGGGARATAETSLHSGSAHASRAYGEGWKVSPCAKIEAGKSFTMASIEGPGVIRHIWITTRPELYRDLILEITWDDHDSPSISVPLGDFFCQAWGKPNPLVAQPVNVNSNGGMNAYWPMPFKKSAKMVIHNTSFKDCDAFFYTVDYTLEEVDEHALYLHTSWRRENPTTPGQDLVVADDIEGKGQFVGMFLAWQQNSQGWWGEGEVKMYLDDDKEYPTICGTGTEDYFGGAWCFNDGDYSAPYLGFKTLQGSCGDVGARMAMYRFHVLDPVFFKKSLKVTCQTIGWRRDHHYLQLKDDISATAWWYQTLPSKPLPALPDSWGREII